MNWSDDELKEGLEAAEKAESDPDGGFRPRDVDSEAGLDLLQELVRRSWATVDSPLRGDGRLMAARGVRLTPQGRAELSAFREAAGRSSATLPESPAEAWSRLQEMAEPFSPFAREIEGAKADLVSRGMYESGPSIVRAMQVAYDHNLVWSENDRAFVPVARVGTGVATHDRRIENPDPRKVFVVYGRDAEAKAALFNYLRALGLHPLEWEQVVALTGTGTPYIGDVLVRGFREAQAAVVLFTPDDETRLHEDLRAPDESPFETVLTCQPRPNVLIEAGMALAFQPDRTIIVQVGNVRPATDLSGRHVLRLGTAGSLLGLATRLSTAGCPVDLTSPEIVNDQAFAGLSAQRRQTRPDELAERQRELPLGTRLELPKVEAAPPELSARLIDRGKNNHLIEIRNRGGVPLTEVRWEEPERAGNWSFLTDVLPEYPIARLEPRDYVRVPVSISLGGPVIIRITLIGIAPDGSEYRTTAQLSVYD